MPLVLFAHARPIAPPPASYGAVHVLAVRAASDPQGSHVHAAAVGAHHRHTELVQNLEGCLVALQAELRLELHSAHSGYLARHEVRGQKPDRDRCVRALHDRVGRERRITFAAARVKHDGGAVRETARFAIPTTVLTNESVGPPDLL